VHAATATTTTNTTTTFFMAISYGRSAFEPARYDVAKSGVANAPWCSVSAHQVRRRDVYT
jgi:hypothetical protein